MIVTEQVVVSAYIECALWASTDRDGRPLDEDYSVEDFAPEAIDSMRSDVSNFLALCEREGIDFGYLWESENYGPEMVGNDFWLTRNHHGAGFWDRGLGEVGDRLTELAHSYGQSDVYTGDDDRLYV